MFIDIAKFIVIFTVIILSFTAGLCKLYQYYDGMVQVDPMSDIKTVQQSSFVDLPSTLKTLFWALFCMSPIESADVVIENLDGGTTGSAVINKHKFTEAVGYVAFACFEVICVIVILNMLIATMSNTFQRVTDNVDVEWTFGRMEVYVQYIIQTTLPPPYNLIPTANGFRSMVEWMRAFKNKKQATAEGKTAQWSLNHCCYIESELDRQCVKEYPVLMSQLVQRYFRDRASVEQGNQPNFDDLRQDIYEIKMIVKDLAQKK